MGSSAQGVCTRVSIDKLLCDGRYQRPIEEKRVARIIDNFDPKLLGALELSKRKDGTYAVIDGQHRFEALKAVGRKQVPALVHDGLSVQQEADLFARTNMGRKPLTPIQRFRAQVFSGDPQAVEIQNTLTKCGFKVDFAETTAGVGVVRAITSVERIYQASGIAHVEKLFETLADLWFSEPSATDAMMIRGMSLFLDQYGDRFTEEHAERLRRHSALSIVRRAKERAIISISNEAIVMLASDEIRKICGLRGTAGRKSEPFIREKVMTAKRERVAAKA